MNNKGYVMSGMSFLLVLPAIMLFMVFLDMTNVGIEQNSLDIQSGTVLKTAKDLEANIPVAGKEVIKKEAENVVKTGIPLKNSREKVKDSLQKKVDQISLNYQKSKGLKVECNITSVDNAEDPFMVRVNSSLYVGKDDVIHQENLSQDISLIDPQYPMPNPLPFVKCNDYGAVQTAGNKIVFGSSLKEYLKDRGVQNSIAYENATTSLIIKKCPYDPYIKHGNRDYNTLKNCIDNGYFHESSDGPCYLCRMEGKGTCPHYGIETFIIPSSICNNTFNNSTNFSTNSTFNCAPSSIDHVIFNDTPPGTGTYQGYLLIYYGDGFYYFILYLDNKHREKYGLPVI